MGDILENSLDGEKAQRAEKVFLEQGNVALTKT